VHLKTKTLVLAMGTSIGATLVFPTFPAAQTLPVNVNVSIDISKTGAPISKYIYGQFLEHGGNIVNEGVWAEMLGDRKFYYPVSSKPPEEPPAPPWRQPGPSRHWTPIGADEFVTMDTSHLYTGEHSPLVKLDKTEPHGFMQSGLAVRNGKTYTGRIILAGTPAMAVKVTLIWGKEPGDCQTLTISRLGPTYHKFPLRFVAKADTDDARLEITGTGRGAFHVGAVSLMPTDNVEGFRKEVIEALRQLHSGVYRFPGGNFVSAYEWRDGVGDIDTRPPIYDPVWHAVQPNDVGTDEFLALCRLLDVEPYITVNAGFGDAWSARELVEYTNGAVTTPMGKWRAVNGHAKPYGVKFWGLGNEPWGDYQMGAMAIEQFELKHIMFAKAMRKVDPSIKLIAGGAMPDVMTGANQSKRISGKFVPDYLSTADWSGHLLAHCLDYIDMLSEHFYSTSNMHTDLKLEKKVNIGPLPLIEWERAPATQVRVKYEHYQEYLKLIPALKAKPVPIALDEWAYLDRDSPRGSYKTVPAYAWAFDEMFRHSDLFQLGAFTFATTMINEDRTRAVLSPTGLLFKMYREHFGSIPVEVSGDSPQPKPIYPAGGDQPAVNPGSDTYPLDVSAALTEDRKTLTFAVLNPSDSEQHLKLSFTGAKPLTKGHMWRMAPSSLEATNTLGQKPGVEVQEQEQTCVPDDVSVPRFSISIYAFSVQ
jgi:alpha-N-arabinofuranosidase